MIGSPADTVEDRSIVVHLKRKLRTDKIEGFHERRKAELYPIQRMLARWYEDNQISLRSCRPEVPEALNDRAQDNVRALCAIADVVGGHWPETLRLRLWSWYRRAGRLSKYVVAGSNNPNITKARG